jgi:ParB-like chromosome segregation protein Spo0J
MAKEHMQGAQLSMFLPAKVLRGMRPHMGDIEMEDYERNQYVETEDELDFNRSLKDKKRHMWQVKLDESHDDDLYSSIASEGVHEPVPIQHYGKNKTRLAGGHHRVAAAYDINPDMEIPVEHENRTEFRRS